MMKCITIPCKTYDKFHEQGVVCSGIAYYVQGVVNKIRGPVFVTAFSPLCMVITAVLGAIVLAEKIHLGRYIYIIRRHSHFSLLISKHFILFILVTQWLECCS